MTKNFKKFGEGDSATEKDKKLDKYNMLGLYAQQQFPLPLLRSGDDYGTSLSKGAMHKAEETMKEYRRDSRNRGPITAPKTRGQLDEEAMVEGRKAAKEAAAEERREARGMKSGGMAKGDKFIQEAIKKPGALRKSLGIKAGETIPAKTLAKAAKAPGKMGQRARLAQTLKKMK